MPPSDKNQPKGSDPQQKATPGGPAKNPAGDAGRARASVIVRSQSGKSSIQDLGRITPQNVKSYLPAEITLQEAARELEQLGFQIDLIAPTQINISGPQALFESVFACKLALQTFPLFAKPGSKARQSVFVAETRLKVPPPLQKLIEAVDLEPAVLYQISATPPVISYDHMELPDDVARGMDATKAHERSITGAGIKLAMVDTGFMTPFHPYYAGKGYNINPVVSDPSDPSPDSDDVGHGTGVAACALAVAPGVNFTMYKVLGNPSFAFSTAVKAKPHIITNSWNAEMVIPALEMAVNSAVASGIVVLFAAGNGNNPPVWPGTEPAVISVGGAYLGPDDSITASNYASSGTSVNNPGRQAPDLCGLVGMAPDGIYIAEPTQPSSTVDMEYGGGVYPTGDETSTSDGWVVVSGTSASTPMVAGVCALLMQADATLIGNPSGVLKKLAATCTDVTSGFSATGESAGVGVDNATGAGLVQAYRAVHATDIWMRDNPDSDIGLVPSTGRRPAYPPFTHWTSPDIKVVGAVLTDPQTDFNGAAEVEPIFNQDNFVYARLHNRGTQDASSVQIGLYYADPSTSLSFPADWNDGQSGVASKGSITVSGAMTNSQTLATIPANGSVVTLVPFVWRPPDPTTATQSQKLPGGRVEGHFCLLSRLTSADDPILFPTGGESSVIDDNNISMKNEEVYSAKAGGMHSYHFFVRQGPAGQGPREFQLVADVAGLPARTVITLEIPALKVKQGFTVPATSKPLTLATVVLKPGESPLASMTLQLPAGTSAGRYPLPIGQTAQADMFGGVTLIAQIT
jgi:hypothetical protein